MAFGKRGNRHDVYVRLRGGLRDQIAATGLPACVFRNEDRFVDFIGYGTCSESGADMRGMTDEQFETLLRVADAIHPDNRDVLAITREHRRRAARHA